MVKNIYTVTKTLWEKPCSWKECMDTEGQFQQVLVTLPIAPWVLKCVSWEQACDLTIWRCQHWWWQLQWNTVREWTLTVVTEALVMSDFTPSRPPSLLSSGFECSDLPYPLYWGRRKTVPFHTATASCCRARKLRKGCSSLQAVTTASSLHHWKQEEKHSNGQGAAWPGVNISQSKGK